MVPPCPLALLLLTLLAVAATPVDPPEACDMEMNKSKDLLQVSCIAKGLTSVPAGLPEDTGILHLGSNHLAQVSLASFQHLSRLSDLDLSNNSLGTLEASSPLPELQQLVLSHNALASLPAFPGLPQLWRLALGHNALSQLPEGGFRALKALRDLELQGNRLRQLPPGAFAGLARLRDLDLSDNDLASLPQDLLAELTLLEILRLERNRLLNLPDGFFPEDTPFAFVYLEENPWRCDCQIAYLRDWILDYDTVYTRTPGPEKEITENNPRSVKCHTPATAKGQPVIDFQMDCGGPGDGESEGSDEATPWDPTTTPPTTTALRTTAVLPTRPRSPAAATPPGTTDSLPSTAALPPPTSSATLGPSMATPTTRGSTEAASTSSSSSSTTTTTPPPPRVSTQATTLAQVPTTLPTTPSMPTTLPTTPSMPTTTPETTQPPPASTATSHPPARSTALALPAVTDHAPSSPSPPVSTRPPARLPSPELPAHCLCPALPAQVQRARRHHRAPRSWAAWLADRCCPLHLALYAACLALVLLPTLAVLCGVGCLHRSRLRPALPGTPGGRPGTYRRPEEAAPTAPWLGSAETPRPVAAAQLYRVCKTFRVAPFRQASWLLVSLPGPGKPKPRKGGPRRPSLYSLDRGRDAKGAVRVRYATSSL